MDKPILIVGAGPTGLTLALTLARQGVSVRIIDQCEVAHHESRALGVHSRTLEIFQDLGVIDAVLKEALQIKLVNLHFKKEKRAMLEMDVLKAPYPFIAIIPQSQTEQILIDKLHDYDIHVERATELKEAKQNEHYVEGILKIEGKDEETFKTPWLIGCDGAHSVVRKEIGALFEGYQYGSEYVLADVNMESSLGTGALNIFADEKGALFIFPIKDERYRIVSQKTKDLHNTHTSLHTLEEMIQKRAIGENKIIDITWISDFKISHRRASVYRKDRMMIAGDAAHIHSPAGGQGLNTGVGDAYNLGWKLAYVQKMHAETRLLSTYSRERIPIAKQVLSSTEKLTKMATSISPAKLSYYSNVVHIIHKLSLLKAMLAYQMSGIAIQYKKSPIIKSQKRLLFFIPAIKAGCRLFDGELYHFKAKVKVKVFDLIKGEKHHLLVFIKRKNFSKAQEMKHSLEKKYPKLLEVHLLSSDEAMENEDLWFDKNSLNSKPYRLRLPFMVMVRPDGYIGMTQRKIKEKKVDYYFNDLLGIYP